MMTRVPTPSLTICSVAPMPFDHLDPLAAVGRLGDDLHIRQVAEDGAQTGPHQGMIVGHYHADCRHARPHVSPFATGRSRNDAAISVPAPAIDAITIAPPASATRSRMLSRPR